MGPRLVSRGKRAYESQSYTVERLQWGRDLLVAESAGLDDQIHCIASCASMGPRLVSRGKVDNDFHVFHDYLASMGPRLVSRGKASRCFAPALALMLQWGRDLLVAERRGFGITQRKYG